MNLDFLSPVLLGHGASKVSIIWLSWESCWKRTHPLAEVMSGHTMCISTLLTTPNMQGAVLFWTLENLLGAVSGSGWAGDCLEARWQHANGGGSKARVSLAASP